LLFIPIITPFGWGLQPMLRGYAIAPSPTSSNSHWYK